MQQQTILTYGSITPGAVPLASNLVTNLSGVELAVNAADGKLFFKDTVGNVRVLADVNLTSPSSVGISGGTIDGTAIGLSAPTTGAFTSLTANSLTISSLTGLLKSTSTAGVGVAVPGTDYLAPSSIGVASGLASLDTHGKVPVSQLPSFVAGGLQYAGFWNAITNTPTLASSVGANGVYYKVSVAGTTNLNGISDWAVGDLVVFNSTAWGKLTESTAPVQSVNGQQGAVVITRTALGAAASGTNSDITALTSLATPLSVAQGGTGLNTLTGLVKASGTSPFSAAVAGVDYAVAPTGTAGQLLASNGAGGFSNVTVGAGLDLAGGVISSTVPAGVGTVTSVNASGGTTGLTLTGGPITNAGTLTLGGTLAVASGGTGATTSQGAINTLAGAVTSGMYLRGDGSNILLSTIQAADIPVLNQNTTGTASTVTAAAQPAITSVGTLTNLTVAGSTSLRGPLSSGGGVGAVGQILTSNGPGAAPSWAAIPVQSIGVTSVQVSGGTTGLTFSGGPVTASGTITAAGVLSVANGGTGTTISTGNGAVVRDTSPVLNGATLFNGEINNVLIGATVPSAAVFTSIASTTATLANLMVQGTANFSGTGALKLPAGTSSQRPVGADGLVRFNTTLNVYEKYKDGTWSELGGSAQAVAAPYKRITSNYLAENGDRLIADTSGGTFQIVLPANPTVGFSFSVADGSDWGVNKMTLNRNGSTIQSIASDYDVTAGKIELNCVNTGSTWLLFAKTLADVSPASGTGKSVRNISPVLVTPNLGTPSTIDLMNASGLSLATGTTGILPAAKGGTGATSVTGLVKGNGSSAMSAAVAGSDYAAAPTGTADQLLASNGAGGFSNVTLGTGLSYSGGILASINVGTVTSVNATGGVTGLTFSGGPITASGNLVLGGTLAVTNGGTGTTSVTGLVKGNGSSAMSAAVAGSDYAVPPSATVSQLLAGNGAGGFSNVTVGSGLFISGGVLTATEQLIDGSGNLNLPATTVVPNPGTVTSGKMLTVMVDGEAYYVELRKL